MSEAVDTSTKEVEEVNTKAEEEELLQDNEEPAITISEDHADVLETPVNGDNADDDMEEKVNTTEDNGETKTEDHVKEDEEEDQGKDLGEEDEEVEEKEDDEEEEEEEEEDEEEPEDKTKFDPNVMPQVNVAVLAKRKWQVKVYPLKPADFASGMVSKVFKAARESLLYLMTGPQSRGKGEMYIQNVAESVNVVKGLMNLDSHFHEINIEVLRKNNEGAIQEKAYMRFDTQMVQMLFQGPNLTSYPQRGGRGQYNKLGKKRERLIGSVFVKNLPPGTSKNMLRVMFPFAQEINYNPEKYSEGTARLVLKSRNTVIPCLKAFAKVELGGNILELHPLEKKRHGPAKPRDSNKHRSSSQKEDSDKEDSKSEETSSGKPSKPGPASKTRKYEPKDKDAEKDDSKKSVAGDKKEGDTKTDKDKKHADKPGTGKSPYKKNQDYIKNEKSRQRAQDYKEKRGLGPRRGGGVSGSRFVGTQRGGRGGFNSSRSSFGAGPRRGMGNRGVGNRGVQDRRVGAALGVTTELAAKVEATKDMMVLQNQLNMAIKGQLAMLNQTKRAVEQAKIGLVSSSSTASRTQRETVLERDYMDERRSRANDSDFGYGSKRNASQASLANDYDDYDRKRSAGASFSPQGGSRAHDGLTGLGGSRAQVGQTGRGRGRGKRAQQQRGQQRGQEGRTLASERAAATSRAIATQSRALQNRSFEERSLAQAQRSQAQRSLAQQSRALAQQQNRGLGQSRASGYDDDLYRQDAYSRSLQDPVDDGYGYGGATESRYSSTGRQDTVRGTSTYDDNYGYSRY